MRELSVGLGILQVLVTFIFIALAVTLLSWVSAVGLLGYLVWWLVQRSRQHTHVSRVLERQPAVIYPVGGVQGVPELREPIPTVEATARHRMTAPPALPPGQAAAAAGMAALSFLLILDGIPFDGIVPGLAAILFGGAALRVISTERIWSRRAMILAIGVGAVMTAVNFFG
jgi:phage shock protein PspC (stress-responsive transcriptional regulator)